MKTLRQEPVVRADMLIRKPVEEVFEAIVNPEVTTKFWFTKSSGKLEQGKSVRWDWEMYGVSSPVNVLELEENKRIVMDWGDEGDLSRVEWTFASRSDGTLVSVANFGFQGDGDDVMNQALDSTGGFTMVLCALKALLEHGVVLTVVADRAPDANVSY
ncbi:SRPBCC family protein [Paenibacillaceae bacterium WGS1546]|uniref:SRPBCC family protein n=1 Tax=Cohnella sp. WGS1546 TaxID=3366810 RepID=UPI00372D1DE0